MLTNDESRRLTELAEQLASSDTRLAARLTGLGNAARRSRLTTLLAVLVLVAGATLVGIGIATGSSPAIGLAMALLTLSAILGLVGPGWRIVKARGH